MLRLGEEFFQIDSKKCNSGIKTEEYVNNSVELLKKKFYGNIDTKFGLLYIFLVN